ncbi:hypothetical protein NC652_017063 [Populus alba x Populus x berolinensis]|nr:hypothetical protein NC652_017059 [Populus alba x Populus x berolinensis]KAJ6923621.1 hypothetical protein NC652_017063 [Populus alba x Populus x berolinensis]
MSPELVKEKRYDYGVDIWALGCAVVEMLSGKPVWPRMDVPGYLYTIGDSQDLPQIPSSISDDAKDFLGKCLVRNAAQRWSADELQEHPFLSVG